MQRSPLQDFPTQYWHSATDGRVCCDVCPRICTLREGKRGACFVRMNKNQQIVLTSYGRSSGFCIDPIEKKPLNHFYPGATVIVRDWYQQGKYDSNDQGVCIHCSHKIAGRFDGPKGNFGPRRIPISIHQDE